jgi:hypothetical protein
MLKMDRTIRNLIILCCIILPFQSTDALIQETGLVALTKSSEYVVHGIVEEVSKIKETRENSMLGRVRVKEIIKGKDTPSHLEIRFRGRMVEDRVAPFTEYDAAVDSADEVILFLSRDLSGDLIITYGVEGKFIVTRDSDGREMVTSPLGVIPILYKDPKDRPAEMPLPAFLELLRKFATYPQ